MRSFFLTILTAMSVLGLGPVGSAGATEPGGDVGLYTNPGDAVSAEHVPTLDALPGDSNRGGLQSAARPDLPATVRYRAVVELGSAQEVYRARRLGLPAIGRGSHEYELSAADLHRLRDADLRVRVVGGTTRFEVAPIQAREPLQVFSAEAGSPTAADTGSISLSSGTIDLPIDDDTGYGQYQRLRNQVAPSGAEVTDLRYRLRIADDGDGSFYCIDYEVWLFSGEPDWELNVYDNLGGTTDGGYDDDVDDDQDIYLNWRSTSYFDGQDPNQWWGVLVLDNWGGGDGVLNYIQFEVDWRTAGDDFEPDDGPAEAWRHPHNATSGPRSIDPVGDQDWIDFVLTERSEVIVETVGSAGDTRMWLYDDSLDQIDFDDDGGDGTFSRIAREGSEALEAGLYYAKIDEYGGNDTIASYGIELSVTSAGVPDLVASSFGVSGLAVREGESFTVETRVTNGGSGGAGPSHTRLFLSIDGDADYSDDFEVLPERAVSALGSGSTDEVSWTFPFPDLLDASNYLVWLVALVDSQDEVAESSESNVFTSTSYLTTTDEAVDFSATEVYFRDQPGNAGNRIDDPQPGAEVYPHFRYNLEAPGPVSARLWEIELDGLTRCYYEDLVDPGPRVGWCLSPWTVTAGSHLLRGVLDPEGTYREADESDNEASRSYDTSGAPEIRIEPLVLSFGDGTDLAAGSAVGTGGVEGRASGPPAELFRVVGPPDGVPVPSVAAVETRRVLVNQGALRSGVSRLLVPLDGEAREVARTGFERRGPGDVTWQGRFVGGDGGLVVITLRRRAASGLFYARDQVYELTPLADGTQGFSRLDPTRFPECGGGVEPPGPAPSVQSLALAPRATPGPADIDVMILYTPEARDAAGGVAGIEAIAQSAVDTANAAFTDSDVDAQLDLVHVALAAYNDSEHTSTDLTWVSTDEGVAALRDEHGADLVALIVETATDACGRGYVMRNPGASFADSAFQVTLRGCAVGNLTYAHEHGHNLGMEHDPENGASPEQASYPWSFGHFVDGEFRTVMSYSNQCTNGCLRVGRFSNPAVTYQGFATGITDQRDNHRTANATAPIAAAFRDPAVPAESFTIFNDGSATLTVSSIALESPVGWIDWSPNAPFDVPPGASVQMDVTVDLAQASEGMSRHRLLVSSNDGDENPYPGGVYVDVSTGGGGCTPDVHLSNQTVTTTTVFEACSSLRAGPAFHVGQPGDVTFRAGQRIILDDGFSVGAGARFEAVIDPSLQDP